MFELHVAGGGNVAPPCREIPVRAVASLVPSLLVAAARIGAEQNAAGLERCVQLPQHPRQLLRRHVEQSGVGVYAVEAAGGQVELEEILEPHLAAAVLARHPDEASGALEAHRDVPELHECLQVAARPATQVEYRERRLALDVAQQRFDVLGDVVVPRAAPECVRVAVVVLQRAAGDVGEISRREAFRHSALLSGARNASGPYSSNGCRTSGTAPPLTNSSCPVV